MIEMKNNIHNIDAKISICIYHPKD